MPTLSLPPRRVRAFLPFFCLFLCAFCFASRAGAATRTVPAQYATIQAAVNAAVSGDTVLLADGTYTGAGDVDIDFGGKNITLTSQNGPAKTIINCAGSKTANHRGFYLHRGETRAALSGVTVKNGFETTDDGGGLKIQGAGVTVQNCTFQNNTAHYGGGIFNSGSGFTVSLSTCTVTANIAEGIGDSANGSGGANGNGGGIASTGGDAVTLTNCQVTQNTARSDANDGDDGGGGGVYSITSGAGSFTMTSCTLTKNDTQGRQGDGIFSSNQNQAGGAFTLTNCTISGNGSAGDASPAVYNITQGQGSGAITMTGCTVSSNNGVGVTNRTGSGNDNDNGGPISVAGCTVSANTVGGIDNFGSSSVPLTITRCTVTGNGTDTTGQNLISGGILNNVYGVGSALTVQDCSITGNAGGGVSNQTSKGSTITVTGCLIADNSNGASGLENDNFGGLIRVTNCVITGNHRSTYGAVFNYAPSPSGDSGSITLTNCTCTANSAASGSGGVSSDQSVGAGLHPGPITLTNDILYGDIGTGVEIFNAPHSAAAAQVNFCDVEGGYPGNDNLNADPLFVNAASGDFHLTPKSPCIGKATSLVAPITDKDGVLRPSPAQPRRV